MTAMSVLLSEPDPRLTGTLAPHHHVLGTVLLISGRVDELNSTAKA